jgi:hypothetical protein
MMVPKKELVVSTDEDDAQLIISCAVSYPFPRDEGRTVLLGLPNFHELHVEKEMPVSGFDGKVVARRSTSSERGKLRFVNDQPSSINSINNSDTCSGCSCCTQCPAPSTKIHDRIRVHALSCMRSMLPGT